MAKSTTLIINSDDTLWHNNIFYEKATVNFIKIMEKSGFSWKNTGRRLKYHQIQNIKENGYGSISFTKSLKDVYKETCENIGRKIEKKVLREIENRGRLTRDYIIHLLPGVRETLPSLSKNFTIFLLARGDIEEQKAKIARSRLKKYFDKILIISEKRVALYEYIMEKYDLIPNNTWVIGNSPRFDINPAKTVGIRTILIPYRASWGFENENINATGYRTIVLKDFSDLLILFELTYI